MGHGVQFLLPSWGQAYGKDWKDCKGGLQFLEVPTTQRSMTVINKPLLAGVNVLSFLWGLQLSPQSQTLPLVYHFPLALKPLLCLLLSTVMTSCWTGEAVQSSSLSASFTFLIGTMTSFLPWKFHLLSCAPTSVPVLRVPIKKGSHLSVSTEHSRVLKLFGSEVSAPGKLLLCRDHEALRDCPLSPPPSGCLLLSSALSAK